MIEQVDNEIKFVENKGKLSTREEAEKLYKQTLAYKLGSAIEEFVKNYELPNHNKYWNDRLAKTKTVEAKMTIILELDKDRYERLLTQLVESVKQDYEKESLKLQQEALDRIVSLEKELDNE